MMTIHFLNEDKKMCWVHKTIHPEFVQTVGMKKKNIIQTFLFLFQVTKFIRILTQLSNCHYKSLKKSTFVYISAAPFLTLD